MLSGEEQADTSYYKSSMQHILCLPRLNAHTWLYHTYADGTVWLSRQLHEHKRRLLAQLHN